MTDIRYLAPSTLDEAVRAFAAASGAARVLAHSCDAATARLLAGSIPNLVADLAPGDVIEV